MRVLDGDIRYIWPAAPFRIVKMALHVSVHLRRSDRLAVVTHHLTKPTKPTLS